MKLIGMIVPLLLIVAQSAAAQETTGSRATARFADPARPGWVKAHLVNGGITVRGYDGAEVVVVAKRRGAQSGSTGLTLESRENNTVVVRTRSWDGPVDLDLRVPLQTSLQLRCVNQGDVVVEGVGGEMDVQNVNGSITLSHVTGSAIAGTTNGNVVVSLDKLATGEPMSFVTFNGKVDLTLPRGSRATLKMSIGRNGNISSDAELDLKPTPPQVTTQKPGPDGRRILKVDRTLVGTLNGGGTDVTLRTFNGDILLRESK